MKQWPGPVLPPCGTSDYCKKLFSAHVRPARKKYARLQKSDDARTVPMRILFSPGAVRWPSRTRKYQSILALRITIKTLSKNTDFVQPLMIPWIPAVMCWGQELQNALAVLRFSSHYRQHRVQGESNCRNRAAYISLVLLPEKQMKKKKICELQRMDLKLVYGTNSHDSFKRYWNLLLV